MDDKPAYFPKYLSIHFPLLQHFRQKLITRLSARLFGVGHKFQRNFPKASQFMFIILLSVYQQTPFDPRFQG